MRHAVAALLVLAQGWLPATLAAQTPDTTAAWRYYPLDVGNVWEYEPYGLTVGCLRVHIAGDTLIEGVPYVVEVTESIQNGGALREVSRKPVRFDTTLASVVVRTSSGEEAVWQFGGCRFDAAFGAVITCRGSDHLVGGGPDTTFTLADGSLLAGITLKTYLGANMYYYIADIGFAERGPGFDPSGIRLTYARIRGVEYGTPISVASEAAPAAGSALALSVATNPVRAAATFLLRVDRPQTVTVDLFDSVGRRVARLHEGPLPAGEHRFSVRADRLPPGLYLARALGPGSASSARVALVR